MFGDSINKNPNIFQNNLPSSLMGIQIDPRILEFRQKILDNPEVKAAMEAEIARKEAEVQANTGTFIPQDYTDITSSVSGVNAKNKNLKEVKLSDFDIEVEDADTVILKRKFSNDNPIVVRLAGLDAPEVGGHKDDPLANFRIFQEQIAGQESTRKLRRLIENQENLRLIVDIKNKTYGRSVGVLVGDSNRNINIEAVREGYASALPFGSAEADIVMRSEVAKAEEQAIQQEKGIWQYSRYKAIREANLVIGGPITYNTLTTLTKLGANLNLGAYESFLQSLGDRKGSLSIEEQYTAQKIGKKLSRQYNPNKWKKFNKQSDKSSLDSEDWIQYEGLSHNGIAWKTRQEHSDFGSGWKGATSSYVTSKVVASGKQYLGLGANKAKNYVNFSRTIGSDDWLQGEGLMHGGMASSIRQTLTDFGSGSRIAINILKGIPSVTSRLAQKGLGSKIKGFFGKSKYNRSVVSEVRSLLSKDYDIIENYEDFIRARYKAAPLPSMKGMSPEDIEKHTNILVESEISGLKKEAKQKLGSEEAYTKLLGPKAMVGTNKIFAGSKEFYETTTPKGISSDVYQTAALLHESLEIGHGLSARAAGFTTKEAKGYAFGSHMGQQLMRDEVVLGTALGGDFKKAFRAIRKKEGSLLKLNDKQIYNHLKEKVPKLRELSKKANKTDADLRELKTLRDEHYILRTTQMYNESERHLSETLQKMTPDGIHPNVENSLSVNQIRSHSDFGTGWDRVRTIAKALYNTLDEEDAFIKLKNSDMFQEAISSGLSRGGKKLGQGAFGSVREYTASIPHNVEGVPTDFNFVVKSMKEDSRLNMHLRGIWKSLSARDRENFFRNKSSWRHFKQSEKEKYGELFQKFEESTIAQEKAALEATGQYNSPSLYGTGKDFGLKDKDLIMEKVEGEVLKESEGLTIAESRQLWDDATTMHRRGYSHMDLHEENILRSMDEKGKNKFAFIDFGMSNRLENTWISKNIWRRNEDIIQSVAQKQLGRPISDIKEFQEMADQSRIYAYMLEGAGIKDVGSKIHTSFNEIIRNNSKESVEEAISTIVKSSDEAQQFFNNASINQDISTNIIAQKANKATVVQEAIGIANQQKTTANIQGDLQKAIDEVSAYKIKQKKTAAQRKRNFMKRSKEAVGIGARKFHNGARQHSISKTTVPS